MKPAILVIMIVSFTGPAFGQDSLKVKQSRQATASEFVDKNANGINDRLEGPGKRKGKDRFVDKDGDGIADDRARGMGFKRGSGTTAASPEGSGPGGKRFRGGKQ